MWLGLGGILNASTRKYGLIHWHPIRIVSRLKHGWLYREKMGGEKMGDHTPNPLFKIAYLIIKNYQKNRPSGGTASRPATRQRVPRYTKGCVPQPKPLLAWL